MPGNDPTVENQREHDSSKLARALSMAMTSGLSLLDLEIDLSNPEMCRFGGYTLLERIGVGGMGIVFRARQESLERDVAIKILSLGLADDEASLARFQFEAKSAAALNHPNIVQILEVGQVDGIAFIAMQLVRGISLAQSLQRQRVPIAAVTELMLKLCDAVGYSHRLRLLHLDLKPANVLIDERGEPLVADFGLARRMNDEGEVEAQEVSGTPGYMAPEQVLIKECRLNAATDIYALGAILYELVCGRTPHGVGPTPVVMQRVLAGNILPPQAFDRTVPRDLEAICLTCLARSPADRYASAEELAADLRRFSAGLPVSVRRPTRVERIGRWCAREPRFAALLAAMLLVSIGASAVSSHFYVRAEWERAGAEGLLRMLMSQTPAEPSPVVAKVEGFRVPVVDCGLTQIHCGGGFDPRTTIDDALPVGERVRYLASLRSYVPKLAQWGNPRLATQLSRALGQIHTDLHRIDRAKAAAATGAPEGLLFAYLLVNDLGFGDATLDQGLSDTWFELALANAHTAWQAQALAQSCRGSKQVCTTAKELFRRLDPDNGAAWLTGLPREPGGDGDAQLLRAAEASRLDHGDGALLESALAFAGDLMRSMPEAHRVSPAVFALEAWQGVGVMTLPGEYCRTSFFSREQAAIEAACRAIAAKIDVEMRPTLGDEFVASAIARHLATSPQAGAEALRRFRDARWILSAWTQLAASGDVREAEVLVRATRERGELAYLRSLVAARGLPTSAPDEFVTREPLPWIRAPVADGSSITPPAHP